MQPELSNRQKADLFAQLATMEAAGLAFDKALSLIGGPPEVARRAATARRMLGQGLDLAQACARSALMSRFETGLLQAAISAGSPAALFRRLAAFYTQKTLLQNQIRSRMVLPGIMLVVALVLPPLPSVVSGQLSMAGYLVRTVGLLGLLGALIYAATAMPGWLKRGAWQSHKPAVDHLLTRMPIFGPMHVRAQARDFFESLALMLEAGLPMFDAMPKALDAIDNDIVRSWCEPVETALRAGKTFDQAIRSLPPAWVERVAPFVVSGEASGHLPEMLFRLCQAETAALTQFYEQVAAWLPRIAYAFAACYAAYTILSSGAFMPRVPSDL